MTRKRSKHRPAVAGLNPVAKAVSGGQALTTNDQGYTRKAQINAHQAALALAQGAARPADVSLLAAAFNVTALLIEAHGHGAEHAALLPVWRNSLRDVYLRANGTASIGELATISKGLELHDALLATVTLAEMAAVLNKLKAHALAGLLVEVPQ